MIILTIFLMFLGICAFLIPGILLSFIIFSEADSVERTTYSLALSTGVFGVISVFLYYLNLYNQIFLYTCAIFLILLFSAILFIKRDKKTYKTTYDKSIIFIAAFSLFGALWRYFFLKYFQMSSYLTTNPYSYSFKFVDKEVPNLGFYTGMAQDKSRYIGTIIADTIFNYFHISYEMIVFLFVFLFLGFIFLVFREFITDKKLAYLGVAVMSIGPIELFYNNNLYGHSLSYILLLPFFLLFKSNNKKIFWIVLFFSVIMTQTYYTSSMIIILCSLGFVAALAIKEFLKTKKIKESIANLIKDKKIFYFLAIFLLVFLFIYLFSGMFKFSLGKMQDNSGAKIALQNLDISKDSDVNTANNAAQKVNTIYKDPTFLWLSAIRWQMLFFFLAGLIFIFYLITLIFKRTPWPQESIDIFLCLIPVIAISYGFWRVNLPARIFDYFAFFGLMSFKLPKKYFKLIFMGCLIFILITGVYVAKDKKVFFEISKGEVLAAKDVKNKLTDKIFSDQVFINQLILNDYYNVTGANDNDQIVKNLFYQKNEEVFLDSIDALKNLDILNVAITQRMREKYVLMVNYPQKPIFNYDLYEKNLEKIYDNGDVKIYSTDVKKDKNTK